ncbi:MAG: response regulator [Planctomycetes bacterium]|nr:response regulator [Planctomycetota bacterium]
MIVRSAQAGGFCRSNRAFFARVGFPDAELADRPFLDWIVEEDRETLRTAIERGDEVCRVCHRTREGSPLSMEVRIQTQGDDTTVLARCAKSSERISLQSEVEVEATVKSTLHKIAQIVEEQNPGYKCSILLVAHGRFVAGAGPSLPDDYNKAIDGFAIGPTVGSCGTAIYWNVPVIVEDIQKDPLWKPFAELAKKAGVAACWSHPFSTKKGRVLGALAFYSPEPRAPTAAQLSALRAAAQMTGLAVERGRAEEELRSANQVKARFMANLSHEIRTPLNALVGITDSLEESHGSASQSDIRMLRDAGEQLLELFTGALELTEVRDRGMHEKAIDLPACCRRIFEPFEASARAKGLTLDCTMSTDLPQWVTLDAWCFERAVRLLVHNAVKFTDDGGVHVNLTFVNQSLHVRIIDTGCGIDLDRLSELRQPFVQGDLSTTKQYAGFGLGLALAELCLQAMGGTLQFAANEPQGTVVSFAFPIRLAAAPAEVECRPARPETGSASLPILVVEDNPLNSKVIERLLVRAGYECDFRENGSEALQAFEQNDYCCILMDCQMPVMDGYEATRRIRELEAGSGDRIPIIAVTANALAEDRDMCLQAGMDDYLKKPVRRQELTEALESYVGKPCAGAV